MPTTEPNSRPGLVTQPHPRRRAHALVRHRRRRARQRDLRVHRGVAQPRSTPLVDRISHARRLRITVTKAHHPRPHGTPDQATKPWVRSRCHLSVHHAHRHRPPFGSLVPLWLTMPVGFIAACLVGGAPPARTWLFPIRTRVRQSRDTGLPWVRTRCRRAG